MRASNTLRRGLLKGLDRLGTGVRRAWTYADILQAELVLSLAHPEDWAMLTVRAYNRHPYYRRDDTNTTLYEWEEQALERFFPGPPARILVCAAGGGREMVCLADRGYDVAGFDPASELVRLATERIDAGRLLCYDVAGYERLVKGVASVERHAPFDGVFLGFGSLGHVGSDALRQALFRKVRELCEDGPVLISWVDRRPGQGQLRVRSLLNRLGFPPKPDSDLFGTEGFVHNFTHDEIFELARCAGYRVASYNDCDAHPHAVFRVSGR